MTQRLTALGMAASASLDGIDLALLETDGEDFLHHGPVSHFPYDRELKVFIRRAMTAAREGRDGAADIGKAEGEVTLAHTLAVERFLEENGLKRKAVDVIGLDGQTILHRVAQTPEAQGRSWQIGDAANLAAETRIDVVAHLRDADIAAGGAGAPIAAVYNLALLRNLSPQPAGAVGVIDLDQLAQVVYAPKDARPVELLAYDAGPASELVARWLAFKASTDDARGAQTIGEGEVDEAALRMLLLHPFLRRSPPKMTSPAAFGLDHVLALTRADGAATLSAFAAECIERAERYLPEPPGGYILCGPGRRDGALVAMLSDRLSAEIATAEDAGWRGDAIAAEAVAYLAVRSLKKLPLTFPKTTRISAPMRGGRFFRAPV